MALGDRTMMAQIYRIVMPPEDKSPKIEVGGEEDAELAQNMNRLRGRLELRRNIHMSQQTNGPSRQQPALNCVKWIPVPGLGIVYATNTGLLKILR